LTISLGLFVTRGQHKRGSGVCEHQEMHVEAMAFDIMAVENDVRAQMANHPWLSID
jgi:hypothetical protein